ncbi:hypothetical protein L1D15_14890 [Vibrio sp. Isolate25]|uniref:hypothetical protein n=1 Tax=Vibrio sp. Isolate25 TaxID=2908535 RepID=UPI001EFCD5D8|nr:hypothetical protein [Vibrio sp. Isolate25]MCG9598005.1 hypothetical protein [Vibrio sp. Isolate25]
MRSNGFLWNEKNWHRIHPTFRSKRIIASISIDAASAETYNKVRGGCFDTLMKNLNFIGSLMDKGELLSMTLIMVYRKSNYVEIPAFIDMAKKLYVVIHPLQAWEESAYVINGEYDDEAIHRPSHPEYQHFKEFIAANNVKHGQDEYTYVDFSY